MVFLIYNGFMVIDLSQSEGFDWDKGNVTKSLEKHGITQPEAEEVFLNFHVGFPDQRHGGTEKRFGLYGRTDQGKILFIAFTIRNRRVRIISARPADQKERTMYEEIFKKSAKI